MQLDTRLPLLAAQQPALQFQPETRLESLGKIAPAINAMRQLQAQQIDMETELRKRQAFDQFRAAAQQAGLSGDLGQLAQVFFTHGQSPEHFKFGSELMKAAQEDARNRRLFGYPSEQAAAIAAPTGAPSMERKFEQAPVAEAAPEMAMGAAGGAQPVNAMMAMEAPAPAAPVMPPRAGGPQSYSFAGRTWPAPVVQEMLAADKTRPLALEIIKANEPKQDEIANRMKMMGLDPSKQSDWVRYHEISRAPESSPEIVKLQAQVEALPANDPRRKALQDRINMLTTRPEPVKVEVKTGPQEKAFETALGSGQAKKLLEDKAVADDAREIIATVQQGRQLLQSGMITGFGAEFLTQVGAALNQAGVNFAEDRVANTQAFAANMAANVGRIIKQFGAGTGLSNADREYAEKMAGGKVTLDRKAIERILDINERAARNVIKLHNERVKGIKTNIPLTVEMPAVQALPAPAGAASRPPLEQIIQIPGRR